MKKALILTLTSTLALSLALTGCGKKEPESSDGPVLVNPDTNIEETVTPPEVEEPKEENTENNSDIDEETQAPESSTESSEPIEDETPVEGNHIKPLAATPNYENSSFPVEFDFTGFDLTNNTVLVDVYHSETFAPEELETLKAGDKLTVGNMDFVVETMKKTDMYIDINDGYFEGGMTFQKTDDGLYVAQLENGYHTYELIEPKRLPLAENFELVDSAFGDFGSGARYIKLDALPDYINECVVDEFGTHNTELTIENGQVTKIVRIWTP